MAKRPRDVAEAMVEIDPSSGHPSASPRTSDSGSTLQAEYEAATHQVLANLFEFSSLVRASKLSVLTLAAAATSPVLPALSSSAPAASALPTVPPATLEAASALHSS